MKHYARPLQKITGIGTAIMVITVMLLTASPALAQDFVTPDAEKHSSQRGFESFQTETPWYDPTFGICLTQTSGTSSGGVTIEGTSAFMAGDPLTLTYPNVTNQAALAAAIEAFIRKASPNSPWLAIANLGSSLVAEAKARNVNPMLIVVIARQESQIGTSRVARENNNSFGNKGNGPSGYRTWPSFRDSLIGSGSFTAAVQDRINGRHPSYKNVKSMYEYLSVHVSGQIIYPGDTTTVHDELMNQNVTAKSVADYFTHARDWISQMTGFKITGMPTRATMATVANDDPDQACPPPEVPGGDAGAPGNVNTDGYSWPMEDQIKRSYGASGPICNKTSGCHHDGTPAFDLMYGGNATTSGKAVYALSAGTIITRNVYRGVPGCYSIQFRSTKDGTYYWYGHLQNPNMGFPIGKPGAVPAGAKIAEVARTGLGPVCHGRSSTQPPGPHLHIDRGCIRNGVPQRGGSQSCRDRAFVPFMNALWQKLPTSKPRPI